MPSSQILFGYSMCFFLLRSIIMDLFGALNVTFAKKKKKINKKTCINSPHLLPLKTSALLPAAVATAHH